MLVVFIVSTLVFGAEGSKVLLLPMPATSHCLEMAGIGNELIRRGHEVSMYAPSFFDPKPCLKDSEIRVIKYSVTKEAHQEIQRALNAMEENIFSRETGILHILDTAKRISQLLCHSLITDKESWARLNQENFDITLVPGSPLSKCIFLLPYSLGIPTVAFGSYVDDSDSGTPFQANTFPHPFSSVTSDMTTLQRIFNTLQYIIFPLVWHFFIPTFDCSPYGEPYSTINPDTLIKQSLLFLENSDYVVDYPKATFPNFVQVGGLTTKPAKPLPLELKTYFDDAKDGVIIMTFGSMVSHAPQSLFDRFMAAFSKIDQRVVFRSNRENDIKNVKFVKWLPQNDALGHPNVKLFISHCGKNGFYEAIYHGVPLVCTPLNGDAFATAIKVKHHGVGLSLDILTASEEDILLTIKKALHPSFREKMKQASALLRDRPETGAQKGARAIEHVIEYGGDHLKPKAQDLYYIQHTYGDVWMGIFASITMVIVLIILFLKCVCCRRAESLSRPKKKIN